MQDEAATPRSLLTVAIDASVSAFTPYAEEGGGKAQLPIRLAVQAASKVLLAAADEAAWKVQCIAGMGGTHFCMQRLLGPVDLNPDTVRPVLARVSPISAQSSPPPPAHSTP